MDFNKRDVVTFVDPKTLSFRTGVIGTTHKNGKIDIRTPDGNYTVNPEAIKQIEKPYMDRLTENQRTLEVY